MVALPPVKNLTIEAIENAVCEKAIKRFSSSIGGAIIGQPCERFLWYRFRWAFIPQVFDGRQLRLFETGHLEEVRMIGWLRDAGIVVQDVDPETSEQWFVSAVDGHLKGFADGKLTNLPEAPETEHLLECKTHNLKNFEQLKKHGVKVSKPEHEAQMQIYMHLLGLQRALYLAKCKDNDELYSERIHYDVAFASALLAKAERIILADRAPIRISDKPDYFLCKAYQCPAYDICHGSDFALRNCRTCLHSSPIHNGEWFCARHKINLNADDQSAGCPSHLFLPALVHGEQIDADEMNETVTYKMLDNTLWLDGEKEESKQ